MLRLKNPKETPSGYWRFPRDPSSPRRDEQAMIYGGDLDTLVARISEYRIINEIPLGDPRAEAEDFLCRETNAECLPVRPRGFFAGMLVKGEDLARFVSALAAWMTSADVVPQEEAERRAEICLGCKFHSNLSESSCAGCYGLAGRIAGIIGGRKTRLDSDLKFCGICSCSLQVVVYAPLRILDRAHKLSSFPSNVGDGNPCWQKAAEGQI